MKNLLHTFHFILILTLSVIIGGCDSNDDNDIPNTSIDIVNNPSTLNGYYDIENIKIMNAGMVLLDSDNESQVTRDREDFTLTFYTDGGNVYLNDVTKFQMDGPVFTEHTYLAPFKYKYLVRDFTAPYSATHTIQQIIAEHGFEQLSPHILKLTVVADGFYMVLTLEKESDYVYPLVNQPYFD